MSLASVLFWTAAGLLIYTYLGYPAVLGVWAAVSRRSRAPRRGDPDFSPRVAVILAVRDEEDRVADRLTNLLEQDYPDELLEIWVASDGSRDGTEAVVQSLARRNPRIHLLRCPPRGKAAAINSAVRAAKGEILVFADARQRFDPNAVRYLVSCFADPALGAVSGLLVLESSTELGLGIESYWSVESWIRRTEARVSSAVGVTGAIYAARHCAYPRLPEGTILDDVYAPMHMALAGWRIGFEPAAVAYDHQSATFRQEFVRKVRTLAGNYQLVQQLPALLSPRRNRLFLQFVSHKLLRLLSPFALVAALVGSLLAAGLIYRAAFAAQAAFYVAGCIGLVAASTRRYRLARLPATFLVANAAAFIAGYLWLRGKETAWSAATPGDAGGLDAVPSAERGSSG